MGNVQTETPPTARRSMGKRIPNLVLDYDNGVGSEFRVQCEVPLVDEDEAASVKKDLLTGTAAALRRARDLVLSRVDRGTAAFKAVVGQAFDDNIRDREARVERPRARNDRGDKLGRSDGTTGSIGALPFKQ